MNKPTNCLEVLQGHGIKCSHGKNISCPLGTHDDRIPSFGFKKNVFHCFGCGEKGDYISLYSRLNNISNGEAFKLIGKDDFKADYIPTMTNKLNTPVANIEMKARFIEYTNNNISDEIKDYLQSRGIDYQTIKNFIAIRNSEILLPMKNQNELVVGIQSRSIKEKKFKIEKGSKSGVFWKNDKKGKELFIVEGMFDYLSLRQFTPDVLGFVSATALIECSELLKGFEDIYWLGDHDDAGDALRAKFIEAYPDISMKTIPKSEDKIDVNDYCVDFGEDTISMLKEMCTETIGTKDYPVSTSVDSYTWGGDFIDKSIDTPKKGEVIVLAGDTNGGKSTYLDFMARQNAKIYNHKVVYFSLEQTKEEIYKKTALSYIGATNIEKRDNTYLNNRAYVQRLEQLREDKLIEIVGTKAENTVTINDLCDILKDNSSIDLLIIDNLSCFALDQNKAQDTQDIIIRLQWLSNKMNIPIILVHHYTKSGNSKSTGMFPSIESISGSSMITRLINSAIQVARNRDPQDDEDRSAFYIKQSKNRSGGTFGESTIYFSKGDFYETFEDTFKKPTESISAEEFSSIINESKE